MPYILNFAILTTILSTSVFGNIDFYYFSNIWWIDIFSHFLLQISIFFLIFSIILLYGIRKKTIKYKISISFNLILSIMLLCNTLYLLGNNHFNKDVTNTGLNIFYQNIEGSNNKNSNIILNEIKQNNSKIVAIVEKSIYFDNLLKKNNWISILGQYNTECNFYIKKNSNIKIINSEIIDKQGNYPICSIDIKTINNTIIKLFLVHPHPPMDYDSNNKWKDFIYKFRNIINTSIKTNKNFIIMGDFNATIFNKHFYKNYKDLYYASRYTWNSKNKIRKYILQLPIDHILSNNEVNYKYLQYNTSDHSPIFIK